MTSLEASVERLRKSNFELEDKVNEYEKDLATMRSRMEQVRDPSSPNLNSVSQ